MATLFLFLLPPLLSSSFDLHDSCLSYVEMSFCAWWICGRVLCFVGGVSVLIVMLFLFGDGVRVRESRRLYAATGLVELIMRRQGPSWFHVVDLLLPRDAVIDLVELIIWR